MSDHRVEISVQASPGDTDSWAGLARRCEAAGFRALLVSDHPGTGPSPFVALAAAAGVTSSLRLGSYVVNAGVRAPLLIAADVATLDVVSHGRAELGIGAGHTPAEWEMTGRNRPSPSERVDRLTRVAATVRELLDGHTVPAADISAVRDLRLDGPRPVQPRVPLLVGGGNRTLLRWGGAHADVVGLSGLGRTLTDGHQHAVRWSAQQVDEQVDLVRRGAETAGRELPPLEALVHRVIVTGDREATAAPLAQELDTAVEDVLAVPYVWIGTIREISQQLRSARERWGISRWVVRTPALDHATEILAAM
jgi:probable F420-dependent oxidoreductase